MRKDFGHICQKKYLKYLHFHYLPIHSHFFIFQSNKQLLGFPIYTEFCNHGDDRIDAWNSHGCFISLVPISFQDTD